MKKHFSLFFIIFGLIALAIGAFLGLLSSLVYFSPDFLKDILPFNRLRPFHVTTVVSWIILSATGGIYFYLTHVEKLKVFSKNLGKIHLIIFAFTGVGICYSFLSANMGGREYLSFSPLLTVPILLGWILFGINYFKTMVGKIKNWPVYFWMWGIGIIFMIYHLSESNFWIFDHFRKDFIRDFSVQWKSYGSFVGSWNMLVYGTGFYVMSKIKDDDNIARGKKTFFFFFLGLTNLMFGWAHHTYIIPTLPWVRYLSYVISMTEWIILISIIYSWKKSLSIKNKTDNLLTYRFLIGADIWVFINLILALLISIPSINYLTHGTHITVAHSMGTTIGINTSILFASIAFIISKLANNTKFLNDKIMKFGFYLFNICLLLFFLSLIFAGIYKGIWSQEANPVSFAEMQKASHPFYIAFIIFGQLMFVGLMILIIPMIKAIYHFLIKGNDETPETL